MYQSCTKVEQATEVAPSPVGPEKRVRNVLATLDGATIDLGLPIAEKVGRQASWALGSIQKPLELPLWQPYQPIYMASWGQVQCHLAFLQLGLKSQQSPTFAAHPMAQLSSHRFSAFWLRSKCSICSYQLNI